MTAGNHAALPLPLEAIRQSVKPKFVDVNLRAFQAGREQASKV